jgi:putative endonuclease
MRQYYVYILASLSRVLYVGVTNNLQRRIREHKRGVVPGFTRNYHVTTLVYFESTSDVRAAIAREKQLKRWPRQRKVRLIEAGNRDWRDLSVDIPPTRLQRDWR